MEEPFRPAPWARSPHIQTIFGSLSLRVWGPNEMLDAARETIVDAGDGVRLLGYHSRQSGRASKGLMILLHGWEGSADSTYILSTGRFFYRRGYDIFRLNLRDHGPSHGLNRNLFHGALIAETARAVSAISQLLPGKPVCLIGFSLGGNFALRIALRQSTAPIANLRRVFAISPSLDPYKSTLAIDTGPAAYRRYFLAKWKRSLREKQRLFPDIYDFEKVLGLDTCLAMTQAIMAYYPEFDSYRDYFRRYTLTGPALTPVAIPVTIFTAKDDPVVSVEDFYHLPQNGHLTISIQPYGGHCGFLDPFPWGCWYERRIGAILEDDERGSIA
jgi:predicted alpha/beta-fold hydrolase